MIVLEKAWIHKEPESLGGDYPDDHFQYHITKKEAITFLENNAVDSLTESLILKLTGLYKKNQVIELTAAELRLMVLEDPSFIPRYVRLKYEYLTQA